MLDVVVPQSHAVPIHVAVASLPGFAISVLLDNVLDCVEFGSAVLCIHCHVLALESLLILTYSRDYHPILLLLLWLLVFLLLLLAGDGDEANITASL